MTSTKLSFVCLNNFVIYMNSNIINKIVKNYLLLIYGDL